MRLLILIFSLSFFTWELFADRVIVPYTTKSGPVLQFEVNTVDKTVQILNWSDLVVGDIEIPDSASARKMCTKLGTFLESNYRLRDKHFRMPEAQKIKFHLLLDLAPEKEFAEQAIQDVLLRQGLKPSEFFIQWEHYALNLKAKVQIAENGFLSRVIEKQSRSDSSKIELNDLKQRAIKNHEDGMSKELTEIGISGNEKSIEHEIRNLPILCQILDGGVLFDFSLSIHSYRRAYVRNYGSALDVKNMVASWEKSVNQKLADDSFAKGLLLGIELAKHLDIDSLEKQEVNYVELSNKLDQVNKNGIKKVESEELILNGLTNPKDYINFDRVNLKVRSGDRNGQN